MTGCWCSRLTWATASLSSTSFVRSGRGRLVVFEIFLASLVVIEVRSATIYGCRFDRCVRQHGWRAQGHKATKASVHGSRVRTTLLDTVRAKGLARWVGQVLRICFACSIAVVGGNVTTWLCAARGCFMGSFASSQTVQGRRRSVWWRCGEHIFSLWSMWSKDLEGKPRRAGDGFAWLGSARNKMLLGCEIMRSEGANMFFFCTVWFSSAGGGHQYSEAKQVWHHLRSHHRQLKSIEVVMLGNCLAT